MKQIILIALFIGNAWAQVGTEIITHDKVPMEANYTQVLGHNVASSWTLQIFPTTFGEIEVEYPQYLKSFTIWRGGKAVPGAFAIKYDRFEGQEYLMFQIYLYWSFQDGDNSWFIAKSYGDNGEVNFYESDPATGNTLNPDIPTQEGGPHVWRFRLTEMEAQIEVLYNLFFDCLKERTRQALYQATDAPVPNPGNLDQLCGGIN